MTDRKPMKTTSTTLPNGNTHIVVDPGDVVLCDLCNEDWTERPESGGFIFQSKAVCPTCAPGFEDGVKRYQEERFIRGRCTPGMSFADWVRAVRR